MGKAATDVQIPGAPAASTEPQPAAPEAAAASPGQPADIALADRDAEIAQLRAALAAKNAPPGEQMIFEADGPNVRRHKAESKHLHLTAAELHKQVRTGKVVLAEHHVLCKDGWYVNPEADKRDRQG